MSVPQSYKNLQYALGDMFSPLSDATGTSRASSRRTSNASAISAPLLEDISFESGTSFAKSKRSSRGKALGAEMLINKENEAGGASKSRELVNSTKSASKDSKRLSVRNNLNKSSDGDMSNMLEFSLVASETTIATGTGSTQMSRGKRNYSIRSPASAASKSSSVKLSVGDAEDLNNSATSTNTSGIVLDLSNISVASNSDSRRNTIDPSAVDAILQSIDDDDNSQSMSIALSTEEVKSAPGSRRSSMKSRTTAQSTPTSIHSRASSAANFERISKLEEDSCALSTLVCGLDDSISVASASNDRRTTIDPAALDDLLDSSDLNTEAASSVSQMSIAMKSPSEAKSTKSSKSSRRLSSSSVKSSAKKLFPDDNEELLEVSVAMSISSASVPVISVRQAFDEAANQESLDDSQLDTPASSRRSSRQSSSLGSIISRGGSVRSSRRNTLENGGEVLDNLLAHLDDSDNTSKVLNETSDNRRETADPDMIRDIMQSLEDDILVAAVSDEPSVSSAASTKSRTKGARKSSLSSVKSPSGSRRNSLVSVNMSPLTPNSVASSKSTRSKASTTLSPATSARRSTSENQVLEINISSKKSSKGKSPDARRLTVDIDDLESFMRVIDEDDENVSLNSSRRAKKKAHDDRRMTADATDMAALLANIETEENTLGRESMVSLDISNLDSTIGRESIETAVLIADVKQTLNKVVSTITLDDFTDDNTRFSIESTASFVSNLSNLSFESEELTERNDRRMTVDAVDLAALAGGLDQTNSMEEDLTDHTGDGSVNTIELLDSVAGVLNTQNKPDFASPRRSGRIAGVAPTPSTALRSCLSTKKSAKKTVVFGSPQAVEFVRDSKTDSFTPMTKKDAKEMFPIENMNVIDENCDGDEETSENSRILDEWDRLTCSSAGSDSEDDTISSHASTPSVARSNKSQSPKSRRRRKSMIQPELDLSQPIANEEVDSYSDEPTGTVELPKSLGDLLKSNNVPKAVCAKQVEDSFESDDDATEVLECDLHSLIEKVGCTSFIGNNGQVEVSSNDEDGETSGSVFSTSGSNISSNASDNSLGALIGDASFQAKNRESLLLEQPDEGMISPSTSVSSFDFGKRRNTLTAPRNSYEPNMSECSGTPMSPLLGGEDEVSINLSNGSMSRRLSKISDNDEIKLLSDSHLDMTVDNDGEYNSASPAVSSVSSKKTTSFLPVEEDGEENLENIDNMLADFEENFAYDDGAADDSQHKSCASDASTIMSQTSRRVSAAVDLNLSVIPTKTSDVMARLQKLNADARRTTLSQCQTPLGITSRLSLGVKRQSFAAATSKIQSEFVEEVNKKKMKESPVSAKVSAKKSVTKKLIPDSFTGLTADISAFNEKVQVENSFSNVIRTGLSLIEDDRMFEVVAADVDEVLLAVMSEANLAVFSDSSLDQQWAQASHAMDKMYIADVLQNGSDEGSMHDIASECVDNVNGKYKIWEARLLEISADSIVEKAEKLREQLETERRAREEMDKEVEYLNEINAPFDKSDAEIEIFEIRNRIRAARTKLEKTRDAVLEVGGDISSLIQEKQKELSKIACSSSEAQISSAEAEAESLFSEKCIQLENLKLSIDSVIKMSWCSINELTTSAISFTANISENFRVNVYFTLSRDPNDVLTVSKVTQSIESAGGDAADEDIKRCRNFYNRVLCDETSGILSKSQISDVKSASDIKSLIQKISGHISHFRRIYTL